MLYILHSFYKKGLNIKKFKHVIKIWDKYDKFVFNQIFILKKNYLITFPQILKIYFDR